MGRRPLSNRMREHRSALAVLIDDALTKGQRGDGRTPEKHWTSWSNIAFANVAGTTEAAVRDWRDRANPSRPFNIIPLLKAFYGDLPQYREPRQVMLSEWRQAGGIDAEDPDDPRTIQATKFSEVANIVILSLNQPTPDNQGNLKVPYLLRFRHDRKREVPVVRDGRCQTVTIDIGLKNPAFAVHSDHWQPLQDSIFRKGKHPHTVGGPLEDSVYLTGDKDPTTEVIVGEPLEDQLDVVMERRRGQSDGPIAFTVLAAREAFAVTPSGSGELDATRNAVLAAIFAAAIPHDPSGHLIVARAEVTPGAVPKDPE